MTADRAIPTPGRWVTTKLPNGRPVQIMTHRMNGRRVVIVKPIKTGE